MRQLIIINGWSVFRDNNDFCESLAKKKYDPFEDKRDWKDRLIIQAKDTHQCINPMMPNSRNAIYRAWRIRFEKIFSYLNDDGVILIGHSLGGMFLLKYLSERGFPKKIHQLHLVSSVIDESWIEDEEKYLGDFVFDLKGLANIQSKTDRIFVYHSTDDPMVPYSHAERLASYLPSAKLITFNDRGHFKQPEFPELLENILHG